MFKFPKLLLTSMLEKKDEEKKNYKTSWKGKLEVDCMMFP